MSEEVIICLQNTLHSGKFNNDIDAVNFVLNETNAKLTLNEIARLKHMAKIQFDTGLLIKYFI